MFEVSSTEGRCYVGTGTGCCNGGTTCAAGVLYPNSQVEFAHIQDGTSNTWAVSEHGDFMFDVNGAKQDWRGSRPHGFQMGNCTSDSKPPSNVGRNFNCTTFRWKINDNDRQGAGWPIGGDCELGVCPNMGGNIPLNSTHPGGVVTGLADGSVSFVSETIAMDVAARMATMDDGQTN